MQRTGEETHCKAIASEEKTEASWNSVQRWLPNILLFEPMLRDRIELRGARMERPTDRPGLFGRRIPIPGPKLSPARLMLALGELMGGVVG